MGSVATGPALKFVGDSVFRECPNLKRADMSKSAEVETVGSSVFESCATLREAYLPDGPGAVSTFMFADCPMLEKIEIPSSYTTIEWHAFDFCTALKSVDMSDSEVTTIASNAFSDCAELEDVQFSDCLKNIGANAFYNCSSLKFPNFPDSIVRIGDAAFADCNIMSSELKLPSHIARIEAGAFAGNENLGGIVLPSHPESEYSIHEGAFDRCEAPFQVIVPDSGDIVNVDISFLQGIKRSEIEDAENKINIYFCGDVSFVKFPRRFKLDEYLTMDLHIKNSSVVCFMQNGGDEYWDAVEQKDEIPISRFYEVVPEYEPDKVISVDEIITRATEAFHYGRYGAETGEHGKDEER